MKVCSCCLKEQPESSYYYNLSGKDGHFTKCKTCCKEYDKLRKQKQKENALPQPRKRILYNSTIPLPYDPKHAVIVEKGAVKVTFD